MSANPFAALGFGSDSEDEGAPKVAPPKAKVAEVKKAGAKPAATNARAKSAPAKKDAGREASDPDTARKVDTRARDANKRGAAENRENREKRNRDRAPREDGEKAPRAPRGPRAPRDGEKNMDRHSRRGPPDQKREQRGGEGKGNWGSAKNTTVPGPDDDAANAVEADAPTPAEPESPAPKEFSYEEYMSMKKVGASLPALPKARVAGEDDKGALPMGTAITRKEKESPAVVAERKLAQKEKSEIVFGVKSYSSTQREERSERPASRGTERGARGSARGARGASSRGGAASAGVGFNLDADFPGLGKN